MFFFKNKSRSTARDNYQSDRNQSIPHYAPHTGWRPADFQPTKAQLALDAEFYKTAAKFLSTANPDPYDGPFMDGRIERAYDKALTELCVQHNKHLAAIHDSLIKLFGSDKIRAEAKLASAMQQLKEVEDQLALYKNNVDGGIVHVET